MGLDRTQCWLLGILTLAFVLRVTAAVLVQQYVAQTPGRLCLIAGDAEGYWELGRQLAHGQKFEIYTPPRKVLRMPGFPGLLAVSIALFGENVLAARILLAAIGTLGCAGVYWLGAELFQRQVGLIAAAWSAVLPAFVVASVMILSETAFAVGLLLSLLTIAWLVRALSQGAGSLRLTGLAMLSGLAAAVACYVRPSWLLFPPVVAGWLVTTAAWRAWQHGARRELGPALLTGSALLFGVALGLAPWTYRNYVVTNGHFIPTTLWMGPSLYDGLNPAANGDSHMEFLQHDALYETLSEYEVDRYYRREAWTWAMQHPGRTLELGWIKLGRYWNLWPNTPQFDHWAVRIVWLAYLLPMFGGALWVLYRGAWLRVPALQPEDSVSWPWVILLTVGPIVYFSGLHVLFVSSLRYRLPAEYPLLVLSAAAVPGVVTFLRRRYQLPAPVE